MDSTIEDLNAQVSKIIYSHLATSSIRLINLHKGRATEPLRCSLAVLDSREVVKFQALSYVWGSQHDPSSIILSRQHFFVTRNLAEALFELRSDSSDQILWVDALCINQSDHLERNGHVLRMHEIYAKAQRVIAWLGTSSDTSQEGLSNQFADGSDAGMGLVAYLETHKLSSEIYPSSIDKFRWSKKEDGSALWPDLCGSNVGCYRATAGLIASLARICERHFWQRLWIVQEIAFSRDIDLRCGSCAIPYHAFARVCNAFLKWIETGGLDSWGPGWQSLEEISHRNAIIIKNGGPLSVKLRKPARNVFSTNRRVQKILQDKTITDLLLMSRAKLCADPRDKIYSLYNIMPENTRKAIDIDYGKDEYYALLSSLRAIIATSQCSNLLSWSRIPQNPSTNKPVSSWTSQTSEMEANDWANWPSWAPNITFNTVDIMHKQLKDRFNACGNSQAFIQFSHDWNILQTKGIRLGTVRWWYASSRNHTYASDSLENLTELIRDFQTSNFVDFFDRIELRDELCQTLTRGQGLPHVTELMHFAWDDTSKGQSFDFTDVKLGDIEKDCLHDKVLFVVEEPGGEANGYQQAKGPRRHRFGQGSYGVASGDLVCVILGCRVPLILRQQGMHYIIIGDAYVHSFMHGEALRGLGSDITSVEDFSIC